MTSNRAFRVLPLALILVFASIASAAPIEFRVLFDTDHDATTGCTVAGMPGIEQVLRTELTETAGPDVQVTRTSRQVCTGVVLGAATDVDATGWAAGWSETLKELNFETRIPLSAFGSTEMPRDVRVGFEIIHTPGEQRAFVDGNGDDIVVPAPPVRRRAVGADRTNVRTITMDDSLADWMPIPSSVYGIASDGTQGLRLLRVFSFPNPEPEDPFLYFAAIARLGSNDPYADDDFYLRPEGESLNIAGPGVLQNDGDPLGQPLTAEKVSDPSRGTVTLNADGSFTYTPNHPGSHSADEFEYRASAGTRNSNVAKVLIRMDAGGVAQGPPVDDEYETREDRNLVVSAPGVLDNDPGKVNLVASLTTPPSHGTVTLASNGGFTYRPNSNFFGEDTFVYTATRTTSGHVVGTATVTITVTPVNDAPSFTPGGNVSRAANAGPYSQTWATNISAGAGNEFDQILNFVVSNNNTALFSVQPSIAPNGVLTFTPAGTLGSATVSVRLEDNGGTADGGDDSSPTVTFTITITCSNITVTNPAATTATVGTAFSRNFTQTGATGTATFTTTSTLPAGVTLATNGTLSGTPTQSGSFPIVVTVTDSNGCSANGPTYTLVVSCQTITVTNPATSTGVAAAPFSQTFTESGSLGGATFSTASTLPAGLTLAANGVLSGTPTQTGTFPITVTVTDGNGCTGTGPTYNLIITCQTITVTNPANGTGTANSVFSETFAQSGAIGSATFTLASGSLPAGLTLAANGVLSGTPLQTGSFPITVTATDSNGCTGTGTTYTIVIGCQTITVNNPANANGIANSAFSETFTHSNGIGAITYTLASGTLPAGLTLAANGTLSGAPTQTGSFPITVTATDANGCSGTGATYTIVIGCQTIAVINPSNTTGTVSSPFSEQFTQSGAIGAATFTLASGALPTGLTLSPAGLLSGTPTQPGTFPITVTVTDANGCTGTSATYTLVINCQTITVNNPPNATGPAGSPFSETFTQTGAVASATFTLASGTLPTGLTLAANGVLSGTPTQGGTFPITVLVTDANGCTGVSATYNLVITCPTITVNNPANANGTASSAFSETFTSSGGLGTMMYTVASGTLPAGLTLAANGTLSGIPTQTGSFPITVLATDANGCTGTGTTYTINIACQTITVVNPANGNGTASSLFSETFTQTGAIGATTFTLASGTLPAGLTLGANGVLSGTPTQTGAFPITVTVTDANGCTGTGGTYTITIGCQTITVNNPANTAGTVSAAFSETFTQTGAIGSATFTTSSTLPGGLTLATNGVLSGTPTEDGTFPIVVTVTDVNGCTGTSATYNLVIGCQVITVNNPSNASGMVNAGFSETFTQSAAVGTTTYTLASGVLPAGLTLAANGTLSGTPTEDGSFPITVTVTDSNGCTGTSATYNLFIACQTITVNNPANATGPAGSPFSETFTQTGAVGTATFTTASTLPTGLTLATNGVLSGTPGQGGTFPITVTVTDSNGCTGTSATYNLVITCPTITVNNPANGNGTANVVFSGTFTSTGGIGAMTYTLASGTLPAGLTLATDGTLSGTPTQTGAFAITVTATDANGCTGTGPTYNINIACQSITVNNPANGNGTANSSFTETFTATNTIGAVTFTLASGTLPAGLTLATDGTLSGTPTQTGAFAITVTVTDANGCTGTGATYNINIACQTITVTNPANANGTANASFTEAFTATNTIGAVTFTLASGTLPTGLTLATDGTLSGTPTQTGSFPITVTATDVNGCPGTSATYNLFIACQTITVTNPTNASGIVNASFTETFTQGGAIGGATFTTASTLPNGITLATDGTLSGTPLEDGTFPIVVTVTDANGCTGTSATYNLVIACQTITVNVPGVDTGTAGTSFSQQFTQTGAVGTATFTTSSTLPAGLTLQTDGTLAGTPTDAGTFAIDVTVTDSNGCTGISATYNLTISCQTITVTNPATTSVQAGTTLGAAYTFTATGILGTANWTLESGTLPVGITLNATSGQLEGSSTVQGSYPITVRVTDTNLCFDISDTYTLDVVCPVITVARTGGGTFPSAVFNVAYTGESFTGSGGTAPYTFAVTAGTFPIGLTLNNDGTISGSPTQTGTFNFTVTATDASLCPGSQAFSIAVAPAAGADTFNNLVNNTQANVVGGTTTTPATPSVQIPFTGRLIANDAPSGAVVAVAGTFATTQGGSVTIAADGTFLYTPPVTVNALATDSFNYTAASDTGGTGTPATATGTATLNLAGRVWYVRNTAGPGGNGQSQSPFNSTSPFVNNARATPDKPNDIIYIYSGDGTTTGQDGGVALLSGEQLIGEGVALVVNTHTLVPAGTNPMITNIAGSGVTLHNGTTVRGLTVTGTSAHGIFGTNSNTVTLDTLTVQNAGAGSAAVNFTNPSGTITVTNTIITNSPTGLLIASGTATTNVDATNSITANAGQRSVDISALGAGSAVNIGAAITDNGIGIRVQNNSTASSTVSFTGTQTLSTGGNTAVTLSGNTNGTVVFSGVLGITTTTGIGFSAAGGGTLEVGAGASTANVTTGAAAASVSINGMTVGAGGVTFDSVNATGPTTGINVVNSPGTVSVNGGTISNAGTGAHMQGATTNLSLTGVTIGGTTTTGITNTTNFGTLTIGASVNVSAATALNLTTGTVSGTFNNVSSTGGTNGVNLNAVNGTWGTTGGALSGASGATFNVSGGTAQITWGGTISQANAANVITIANKNSGLIDINGNVTSSGSSTGLSISGGSGGTYSFDGTNVFSANAGTPGGITIGPSQAGTISFSNNTSITTTGSAFVVAGGGGVVTAAITYGGTITKNSGGILISVDNLDSPGTLSMTHTPAASGNILQNSNAALGISIINSSSTNITIADASVTFQNASAGFTASGNTGGTINLSGLALTGTGNKGGMLISGAGTINVNGGAANPSINLSAGNNAASKAIDGTATSFTGTLNLTNATITGNATVGADIVTLTGGGTGVLGGTGSTISGANRALVLNGVALTNSAGMASVSSSGGANGISLTNVTGGPYTIGGGSLTSNTGSSFLVSGGTRAITYAGTITQSTAAQRAVDIQASTGGTINFTGAISSTGAGIFANNNGGTTMSYRGGISLTTTTNPGFTATAGGTVEVCDENPCNAAFTGALVNSITTTTGTSLNVANTTISGNNLEFRSITANGATNGILLNTTGATGRLRVNGLASAGSGGTIQATTGDAISLTSTQSPSFNLMNITNTGGQGVNATSLTAGLTVTNSAFSQTGNSDNEHSIRLFDISGTVSVQNTSFNNTAEDFINIDSSSNSSQMTLDVGTTTACTFTQPNTMAAIRAGGAFAGNGILITQRGAKDYTINVSNSTFTDIKLFGFQLGTSGTSTAGNVNVNLDNNDFLVTITNALGNPNNRANATNVQGLNTVDIDASITNNLLDGGGAGGIQFGADNSSSIHANITGNVVTDQFVHGMTIAVDENANMTLFIDNNTISNTSANGIWVFNNIAPGGVSTLNATISNNNVSNHSTNVASNADLGGIVVFGGVDAADVTFFDINGNSVSGNPAPGTRIDYWVDGSSFGDAVTLEGAGVAAVTEADFLAAPPPANTTTAPAGGRTFIGNTFYSNGATVPLPVLTP